MPQYMSINPSPTQQQSASLIGDALVQVRSLADLSHVLAADVPTVGTLSGKDWPVITVPMFSSQIRLHSSTSSIFHRN
jgi:hypothetical protein